MRGFSLIEALVAVALTLIVIGATVPLVATNAVTASAAVEMTDEQQRARSGADAMVQDLLMAGAGLSAGPHAGSLIRNLAPVLPRKHGLTGADAFNVARPDAITIIYVPATQAQSVLSSPMTSPADYLQVDPTVGCPHGTQVCGLRSGGTALLFDGIGAFDLVGILNLQSSSAVVEHRQQGSPVFSYGPGAAVAEAESHTYYFDRSNLQLRHSDGSRTDVPVIDNVVNITFEYFGDPDPPAWPRPPLGISNCLYDAAGARLSMPTLSGNGAQVPLPLTIFTDGPWCGAGSNRFDADLLRIRTIRLTIRVQTGNGMFRGTSSDFLISGNSRSAARSIPDYTLRFDVTPRNLDAGQD